MALFNLIFKENEPKKKRKPKTQISQNIDGILIVYRKHPFSRSIKITPKTNLKVLVTLPKNTSFQAAKDFVFKNIVWVKEQTKIKEPIPLDVLARRRKLAWEILPKRLDELAKKYGFTYRKVFIKSQRTVWGSCSYNNNINLNSNLVALDNELIDYVILHELTHTVYKNHQKEFYNLLIKNMPNALEAQKRLKKVKLSMTFD